MRSAFRLLHLLFATAPFALVLTAYAYGIAALTHRYGWEVLAGPAVGEILRFDVTPGAADQRGGSGLVVEATRLAGQGLSARDTGMTCRIAVQALRRGGGGGSLLVVAREPGGEMLHLRWAGGSTDAGAADCGSVADLRMRRDAFLSLQTFAVFGTSELPQPIIP